MKIFNPIKRLNRYLKGECIVCKRDLIKSLRYCSLECFLYDKKTHEEIINHPIKTLLFGHVGYYKNHWKYKNKEL